MHVGRGFFSGLIGATVAFAWLLLVDAVLTQTVRAWQPRVSWAHILPAVVSTFGFAVIATAPVDALRGAALIGRDAVCARAWLFGGFMIIFLGMMGATLILGGVYSKDPQQYRVHNWPGVAGLIHSMLMQTLGLGVVVHKMHRKPEWT